MALAQFEWDAVKAVLNFKKHGVSFEEATTAFGDPSQVIERDESHEDRLLLMGYSGANRLLIVVHVEIDEHANVVRLISARKVNKQERARYEKRAR